MSLFLLVLFICATYLQPAEFFPTLVPYRITLWIGLGCGLGAIVGVLLGPRRPSLRMPQLILLPCLVAAVALSNIAQGWFGGAIVALADFGATATLFFAIVLIANSLTRLRVVVTIFVAGSVFLATQALIGYHGYDVERFVVRQSADSEDEAPAAADEGADSEGTDSTSNAVMLRLRGVGFLADPNDFAQELLMVLPLLALAWEAGHALRNFALVVVPTAVLLYTIYLTRSRGAFVGLTIIVLLAVKRRWGYKRATVATVGVFVLGLVFQASVGRSFSMYDQSSEGRLEAWSEGLQMLRAQPLFGVGYKLFTDHNDLTAHNAFVLCFAELGLIGYFFWLSLLVISGIQLSQLSDGPSTCRIRAQLGRWASAIRLSLYGFLGAALFLSRTYNVSLYTLLAFTVVLVELARYTEGPVSTTHFRTLAFRVGLFETISIAVVYAIVRVFNVSK